MASINKDNIIQILFTCKAVQTYMRGSRNFCRGSRPAGQLFFPQLILQWGSNGFIAEKDCEWVQLFPGGGGGGVQMLISIETHVTCHFPGEVRTPIPPLDPHMT